MSEKKIRILLVDDHPVVRQSWKMLLNSNPRFDVVAESETDTRAVQLAEEFLPDIMLVDLNMSHVKGFSVTQSVIANSPSVKVIGISISTHPRNANRMIELGAKGYITKTSSLDEITQCILTVSSGGTYICEEIRKNIPAPNGDTNS